MNDKPDGASKTGPKAGDVRGKPKRGLLATVLLSPSSCSAG